LGNGDLDSDEGEEGDVVGIEIVADEAKVTYLPPVMDR
jgi:uncharacterized protein YuzE